MVSENAREESRRPELAAAEFLLRIATNVAHVGVVVIDAHRTCRYVNTSFADLVGRQSSEIIGARLTDVLPETHEEPLRSALDAAFTGEDIPSRITRTVAGGKRHYDIRIAPDQAVGSEFVVFVINDRTEERRADEERERQQTIWQTERELTLDGILVVDEQGKVLSYNGRFAQMWGIPSDVLATRVDAVLLQSVRDKLLNPDGFMKRVQHLYDRPEQDSHDQVELKDGRILERYSAPMRTSHGRYSGRVWYFRDVTEREHAVAALRAERDRAQRYLDTAEVILLALDTSGRIKLINRNGCDLLGWSESELLGKDWITMCLPPENQKELRQKYENLLGGDVSTVVNPILTKDGDERLIEWRNTVLRDESGSVTGTLSSGADITERRALEEQYHQAQKMEVVGRLAGGVAHDFNNLLTAILVYCQLLLDDLSPDDPRRADIMEIHNAGESAARLTRQLLTFSRKQIVEPRLLNLNDVIENVRGMLARLIGEDVRIELDLGAGLAKVTADGGQVEQVLVNLAVNARDAMRDGGILTIETANVELERQIAGMSGSLQPGAYVTLRVTDTGTGMTPDVMAHLFEPFFTTKEAGKGTGLGLATVHGIVARSGGQVTVQSEPGKGSSFTVYFPQTELVEQVPPTPTSAPRVGAAGETILVVEDAEGLRELTKRLLERDGYRVLLASNASEALELCERFKVDLILSDVIMPGGSGPDLMKRLMERQPTLKVVYMSGYTEDAISHHGVLDAGIAFVHKPFTAEGLSRKVREELDR